MRVVAKGQAERWCSHPVSACFVDLLKPGRDADLVTFHFHHALLDQERQGAFNFLGRPAQANAVHAARQDVLAQAYQANPERFVRKAPVPPSMPTQTWINPPRKTDINQA